MDDGCLEISRLSSIAELGGKGFRFTGYESDRFYRAGKRETEGKVVISLELVRRDKSYVKKWAEGPSYAERRREIIAKGLSYGAFAGGRMVGALIMEKRDWNRTLHVEDLEVMPDWQGRGVGRRLMEKADEVARGLGVRAITLETQNTNFPAIRFYRQNGYEIECVDLSLYTNSDAEDGEVAIIMKKKIFYEGRK